MTSSLAKYGRTFGIGLKAGLEYRANFAFSVAAAVAPIIIQVVLWLALYAAPAGGEGARAAAGAASSQMFGFTLTQMIAYTVIAQLTRRLVQTGFEYEINEDIKGGGLDRYLVKPVGYFGFRLFVFFGDKSIQLVMMSVLLGITLVVLQAVMGFATDITNVVSFLASLPVAFFLNFLIFWCVGMSGFWLTDIGFLYEAVRIVIIAAAGGIFPLQVLGNGVATIMKYLPFWFTVQFPTELLSGRTGGSEAAVAFAFAGAWIVVLTVAGWLLWRTGLRRFAAVGS